MPTHDVHTHVGLDQAFLLAGWWPYAATAQDLLERMDAAGIDRAVCFPFVICSAFDAEAFERDRALALRVGRTPYDPENRLLVQEVERLGAGDRLLPFAMLDPGRSVPEQLRALEPLVGRIAGLKTQPTVLQSPIRSLLDVGRDLMSFAAEHSLPIVVHTAVAPNDTWAQVRDCLDVAEAYPKVRFNLAHSLRFDRPMLERAAQLPNVWVDCSAHLVHCHLATEDSAAIAPRGRRVEADYTRPAEVLAAVYEIVGERYLWGSDHPFQSWCDDEIRFVCRYRDEVDALRATPAHVQRSMSETAPVAWLTGEPAAQPAR